MKLHIHDWANVTTIVPAYVSGLSRSHTSNVLVFIHFLSVDGNGTSGLQIRARRFDSGRGLHKSLENQRSHQRRRSELRYKRRTRGHKNRHMVSVPVHKTFCEVP